MTFDNLLIHDNIATIDGGGIFTYSDLTLTNSTIINNTAYYGGGLYMSYITATITGGTVRENSAEEGGGAYLQHPIDLSVTNSDWGEGQELENNPDDVGCYLHSFGWFGDDATFSCTMPEFNECICG